MQRPRTATSFDAFLFSCKTALAAVLAYLVYGGFHLPGAAWAAPVSAVIVSQPMWQPSVDASLFRFWANLIGAGLGAVLVTLLGPGIPALLIGVLLCGLACHYLRLDDALRPAFASVVIVILTSRGSVWWDSLDRVLAVMVGCGVALLVGLAFDKGLVRYVDRLRKAPPKAKIDE